MMRVAIVVPEYRTGQAPGGGVAAVTDFVLKALKSDDRIEVEVVSPRMWHRAPESQRALSPGTWMRGPRLRQTELEHTTVTYVGSHWAEIESFRFRGSRLLRSVLESFDVLVVVSGSPASFEFVRGLKKPVLGQVATTVAKERQRLLSTGSPVRRLIRRFSTNLVAKLDQSGVKLPDRIFVENPWMATWCQQHGARNVSIELPGVDTDIFSPATVRPNKRGYMLSVGRLADPRKNLPLLLRAYAIAREDYGMQQRLVIAGRHLPPTEALDAIRILGLEDVVSIESDITIDELAILYRGADFFAMSSSEEGLGIVMMEAMASGLPVVSTATEGAKVIVGSSDAGALVEFGLGVESRLASAMSVYANNEIVRQQAGESARARAQNEFSSRLAGERFIEAIVSLIDVEQMDER